MDWAAFMERFGFPTLAVVFMSVAIAWSVRWLAANAVKPIVDAIVEYIGQSKVVMREQATILASMGQTLHEQADVVKSIVDRANRHSDLLKEIRDTNQQTTKELQNINTKLAKRT